MRLFFASDIHGSTTCFRKLVNAGAFYGVDYVIMGGDLAGKELVPLSQPPPAGRRRFAVPLLAGDRSRSVGVRAARWHSRRLHNAHGRGLRRQAASRPGSGRATVHELVLERTEEWVALAAERLGAGGVQLLIGLGNDDFDDMVELLDNGPVRYARDGRMELGEFTLASIGWSNVTPWRTNRECSEEELGELMDDLRRSDDPARTIFNIHVPPYDSGLDSAPRLAEDLQIQLVGGQPDMVPVGSTAVAKGIREFQPVLSLHGHIHEGRGVTKFGQSTVVNPGSEYDQASLLGVVVEVTPGRVKRCQLVAG